MHLESLFDPVGESLFDPVGESLFDPVSKGLQPDIDLFHIEARCGIDTSFNMRQTRFESLWTRGAQISCACSRFGMLALDVREQYGIHSLFDVFLGGAQ